MLLAPWALVHFQLKPMSPPLTAAPSAVLNLQNPKLSTLFTPSLSTQQRLHVLFPPISLSFPKTFSWSLLHCSFQHSQLDAIAGAGEDEEHIVGDCLVFEEGVFDDPFLENSESRSYTGNRKENNSAEIEPENLIPEQWLEIQKEINLTKKEKRQMAWEMEHGRKVEKRKQGARPISFEEYEKFKYEKLKQLTPIVLDNPDPSLFNNMDNGNSKSENRVKDNRAETSEVSSSGRVEPRNPRLAVYGRGMEDISEFFNSGDYDPDAAKKSQGPRKLFTKEEKLLLNRKIPNLGVATSGKWHPLHTLAAAGEFYLVNSVLKHNADINACNKDGMTAIHKAILGKKQAIFNYLLRQSANPFIRDKDGATLLHYAVRRALSQMIKILLLYNVDINLQDNEGWTPLHLAVQTRRTDIVRLLLIKGADVTIRNKDGFSPLDLCLYSGRDSRTYELIKLLKLLPKGRN